MICVLLFLYLTRSSMGDYKVSIIHFNDFHARYEPVNNVSGTCKDKHCIGGFSKLYSATKQLMQTRPNPLLLNAGDNFRGTLWYNVHKWNVTQHFLNKLPLDAITLGNHEFDDKIDGLVPFLRHLRAPIVVANIDDSKEPRIQGLYNKSTIIERNGKKIGVIGVILATTNLISSTENLRFLDESDSVNAEAGRLISNQDVFTNIVLSHCGYEVDLEIARKSTSKISLIVGGHTDTFLYTGSSSPGPDERSGPYPTVVINKNGNKVLVVQASAYTKYLGNLSVTYHDNGTIKGWTGNPVFLDDKFPPDPDIDEELATWKIDVDRQGDKILGESLFKMPHKICRSEECLLGNFATDAMVFSYVDLADNFSWSYASVAIVQAGGMRASIGRGKITYTDLVTTFPFEDTIDVCQLKGEHLKEILENSIDDSHLKAPHFFQVSGIHVVFNISNPEGRRVERLQIRCRECEVPTYENIDLEKYYRIVLPGFLLNHEVISPLFKKYARNKIVGSRDSDVFTRYLEKRSPVFAEIEGRIKIVQ